jgi:hypothetical protein
VIVVLAVCAGIVVCLRQLRINQPPVIINSQGPTIEKLEKLSQLVTTRVQVADVLVGEGNGCRGSWLIKGDALLSVNLGQAKITDKQEDAKQATIILPEPQVLQPRVDHSRTRTWSVERVAWLPWSADQDALRDTVYAEAQKLVAYTAASAENISQAKLTAETVLKALYAEVGWTVTVKWDTATIDSQRVATSPV